MKNILFLIILLNAFLGFSQSELKKYTNFIENQKQSPIDYILELFETNDIIILGERDHRDTSQYDLILDIIRDERFINKVGHVYTEVGVINQTKLANEVLKGDYDGEQKFNKEFVKLYRNLDFNPLWDKYNMVKYLKGIYEINKNLENEKKITIGLTDCAFEWEGMTHEKYIEFEKKLSKHKYTRDSIMAFNFMQLYEQQKPIKGHKKALLIQNRPHAINSVVHYKGRLLKTTGSYIKNEYANKVKIIAFNWYKWMPPEWYKWMPEHPIELTDDGKWDAAFEFSGNKSIGFNIKNTPFGITEFDYSYEQNIMFQDVLDGLIFYKPFYEFTCVRGVPEIVDIEFAKELIKRNYIVYGKVDDNWTPMDEKKDWDDFRSKDCVDYNKLKIQMNKWKYD